MGEQLSFFRSLSSVLLDHRGDAGLLSADEITDISLFWLNDSGIVGLTFTFLLNA